MQIYFLAGVDENKRCRIGEGWTKIRGAQNKRGQKLKGAKIKGSKVYNITRCRIKIHQLSSKMSATLTVKCTSSLLNIQILIQAKQWRWIGKRNEKCGNWSCRRKSNILLSTMQKGVFDERGIRSAYAKSAADSRLFLYKKLEYPHGFKSFLDFAHFLA